MEVISDCIGKSVLSQAEKTRLGAHLSLPQRRNELYKPTLYCCPDEHGLGYIQWEWVVGLRGCEGYA